ncbi:MAG: hypothetical protein HYX32_15050 [Actinobacteria bacterium]|nr:hypothetical protein [Actinomycetota bacterium]
MSDTRPSTLRALVAHRDNVHAMIAFDASEVIPSAEPLGEACNTEAATENATESPTTSTRPGFGGLGGGTAVDVVGDVGDVGAAVGEGGLEVAGPA